MRRRLSREPFLYGIKPNPNIETYEKNNDANGYDYNVAYSLRHFREGKRAGR